MASALKKLIREIAGKKAPGPSTTFTVFHIFYALELLAEKPIGRNKLAEKLEVGEGAIRTIVGHLKDYNLIQISKEGCSLTKKGCGVWCQFEEIFPKRLELPKTELTTADCSYAFLVKNAGQKVKSGIDQRDAAVIAGARKALVIVYKNGHLRIESVSENIEKDYPKAADVILKEIAPMENDVILIAGAETSLKAKRGAFAASWSLVD